MIGFLLILFHQGSEESRKLIKEYRIVNEDGQERSNDSSEEGTEDLPHNEHRRGSAIAESRIAQVVRDTPGEAIKEERSEMEAQLK